MSKNKILIYIKSGLKSLQMEMPKKHDEYQFRIFRTDNSQENPYQNLIEFHLNSNILFIVLNDSEPICTVFLAILNFKVFDAGVDEIYEEYSDPWILIFFINFFSF